MNIFQLLGLILITTFYSAYIFKQMTQRKQGIQTNRLLKGDKPKRTRNIEWWLTLFTFLMPAIQYGSIIFENQLSIHQPGSFTRICGLLPATIGVVYFICALTAMKNNWRAGVDKTQHTNLVTNGIYRISRNPAFMGFDLLYWGIMLAFSNLIIVLATAITILLIHLQILEEEKHLSATFGKAYKEYKKKVRRY